MSKPVVDIACEHHGAQKTCRGCGKCAGCCCRDFVCCGLATAEQRRDYPADDGTDDMLGRSAAYFAANPSLLPKPRGDV